MRYEDITFLFEDPADSEKVHPSAEGGEAGEVGDAAHARRRRG